MNILSSVTLAGLFTTSSAQLPSAPLLLGVPTCSGCPPSGPLLPRSTDLAHSAHIQNTAKTLTASLNAALNGEIKAGWAVDNVSFSLAVVSPYGALGVSDNSKPLWEYHHRAKNNEQGVDEVDGDTQYMIGSVSKLFSDLMLMKLGVDLRTPVTEFLPRLRDSRSKVKWEDITLEMLADHLAGIPPNAFYEFYFLNSFHENLGLPHLYDSEYPQCGVFGLNSACTREEMIETLLTTDQVVPPNSKPVYSQLSFAIYTLCLEAHTGKNYSQLLDETIYKPLNLLSSGVSPGDTDRAAVPLGLSSWGSDFGFNAPGGGLYSTSNDLTTFLSAILSQSSSILSTPSQIRSWLKPHSTTSSLNTLVGRPWEILRTTDLLPSKYAHSTVDVYAKSGGAIGYIAMVALVEQYGLGLSILTAGPVDAMDILYRAVLGTFVPALEEEARLQSSRFTGVWSSASSIQDSGASAEDQEPINLTLTIDDGPGLLLTSLTRGNASIIAAIKAIWEVEYLSLGFGILSASDSFRIYPTDLVYHVPAEEASSILSSTCSSPSGHEGENTGEGVKLTRQDWRISLDIIPLDGASMSNLPGQHAATQYCGSWQTVGWMTYGGVSLDKIIFVVEDRTGEVVGVEVPGLRSRMLTRL